MLETDATCPLCGTGTEDDIHIITGCSATHTLSVKDAISNVWRASLGALRLPEVSPPGDVVHKWALQLALGLIPVPLLSLFHGEPSLCRAFFGRLSLGMIEWFGARMAERETARASLGTVIVGLISSQNRQCNLTRPSHPLLPSSVSPPHDLLLPTPDCGVSHICPSERSRLWRLRQSVDLSSWVCSMGRDTVCDPSLEGASSSEALLHLWEMEFGPFPAAGNPQQRLGTWTRALEKAFHNAGEPFSLFPPMSMVCSKPPRSRVLFPIRLPSVGTHLRAVPLHQRGEIPLREISPDVSTICPPLEAIRQGLFLHHDINTHSGGGEDISPHQRAPFVDAQVFQDSPVNLGGQTYLVGAERSRDRSRNRSIGSSQVPRVDHCSEVQRHGAPAGSSLRAFGTTTGRKRGRSAERALPPSSRKRARSPCRQGRSLDKLHPGGSALERFRWLWQSAKADKTPLSCPLPFLSLCCRQAPSDDTPGIHREDEAARQGTAHSRMEVKAHGRATVGSAMNARERGIGADP